MILLASVCLCQHVDCLCGWPSGFPTASSATQEDLAAQD